MFIVMHCGGMPFNGGTLQTQSLGGSETAAYYLAKELAAAGHEVVLFTNSSEEGTWDGVRYRWAGEQTEQTPLGDRYQVYAVATPHDLNITQRHPAAFQLPVAAKVTALWLHDLPVPQYLPLVRAGLSQTDLIFTVSDWHKQRVEEVWGINPDNVFSVENGIDLRLFDRVRSDKAILPVEGQFKLLYSSRPERGLETLVRPGGIMERLAKELPDAHLYVCGYDNTTGPMVDYYRWLHQRCEGLDNVTFLGYLPKDDLADLQRQCDLHVYPTKFEETSCITAMEAQAAGLPFLATYQGALPETCEGSGSILLPPTPCKPKPRAMEVGPANLEVDVDLFIDAILQLRQAPAKEYEQLRQVQRQAAKRHTWDQVAKRVLAATQTVFDRASPVAVAKHFLRVSDIYALKEFVDSEHSGSRALPPSLLDELDECYAFTDDADWSDHYRRYYEYEKARGVDYGPESLDGNDRFEFVSSVIEKLPAGATVLDYGCAHGHYTMNLAQRFPHLGFVGVDITPSNIDKARKWAEDAGAGNTEFIVGQVIDGRLQSTEFEGFGSLIQEDLGGFDAIIAAEVLEHVARPQAIVDTLKDLLRDTGVFITTTPYGAWEAIGYEEHWPWRAHVHHFEREDLQDLFGHFPNFSITTISAGRDRFHEPLGSYACVFGRSPELCGVVDYERKFRTQSPRQTVSACLIVRDAENTVSETLESIAKVVDEVIVGIDEGTTDHTLDAVMTAAERYCPRVPVHILPIKSPREIGFDAARNLTIERAGMDWVLWIDSDEILEGAQHIFPRLRHNPYQSYAIAHHHFSIDPAGVLKTDYPSRLFRNRLGIRFYGVVHEHPELIYNEGIAHTDALRGVSVAHYGYRNEDIRRARFDRNWPLLLRDRETYPDRKLGKFLYLRDIYQQATWKVEAGHGLTLDDFKLLEEGVVLWESIVRTSSLRFALESLEWYSGIVQLLGIEGVPLSFAIGRRQDGKDAQAANGYFYNQEHANLLVKRLVNEV